MNAGSHKLILHCCNQNARETHLREENKWFGLMVITLWGLWELEASLVYNSEFQVSPDHVVSETLPLKQANKIHNLRPS